MMLVHYTLLYPLNCSRTPNSSRRRIPAIVHDLLIVHAEMWACVLMVRVNGQTLRLTPAVVRINAFELCSLWNGEP